MTDKEKILSISRSENRKGDEMKKINDMKAAKAGLIAMTAVNVFVLLYDFFFAGADLISTLCPIFAGICVLMIFEYRLNRKYWMLVLACIFSVLFIAAFLLVVSGMSFSVVFTHG